MNTKCESLFQHNDQVRLEALLRSVQVRLGTQAERPDDMACARTIAHRLNNLTAGIRLRQALERLI